MGIGDWWRGLWAKPGGTPTPTAPEDDPSAPAVRVDSFALAPQLRVHMFRHAICSPGGVVPLRTFLSEGLSGWGASEVSVTQPAGWGDAAMGSALNLLKDLAVFAADGRPAVLGGYTGFRSKAFGLDRLVGVTYARGTAVRGLPGGVANLAAVLLHAEEYELVQRGLAARVLGRLAARALYFPYPACWELRDRPVLGLAEQMRSVIHDVGPRLPLGDARVTMVDDLILDVSLPPEAVRVFRELWEASPTADAFFFPAHLAPDADAQRIWLPDATEPHATARSADPPRRMGYAFGLFATTPEASRVTLPEDGAMVGLTPRDFAELRESVLTGRDVDLPVEPRFTLRVRFRSDAPVQPGWVRHEPSGGPRVDVGRVAVSGVTLLVTNDELAERVETRALADLIERATQAMERVACERPVDAKVPVAAAFTLRPGAPPEVQVAWQGTEAPALLGPLHEALIALEPIEVRGEVAFRLETEVHPHPLGN